MPAEPNATDISVREVLAKFELDFATVAFPPSRRR
jgi:hypothetical protein